MAAWRNGHHRHGRSRRAPLSGRLIHEGATRATVRRLASRSRCLAGNTRPCYGRDVSDAPVRMPRGAFALIARRARRLPALNREYGTVMVVPPPHGRVVTPGAVATCRITSLPPRRYRSCSAPLWRQCGFAGVTAMSTACRRRERDRPSLQHSVGGDHSNLRSASSRPRDGRSRVVFRRRDPCRRSPPPAKLAAI